MDENLSYVWTKNYEECMNISSIMISRAFDSSLVLMISFRTGVDIMARYQLLNNNNNKKSRLDICLLKDWVDWELTMVVGRAFQSLMIRWAKKFRLVL